MSRESERWARASDEEEFSVLTADGRLSTVDNRTLHHTPAPLAASTVTKQAREERYFKGAGGLGSFLEESSLMSPPPNVEDLSLVRISLDSSSTTPEMGVSSQPQREPRHTETSAHSSASATSTLKAESMERSRHEKSLLRTDDVSSDMLEERSSLGLINLESMHDLSSSVLHYDISPEKSVSSSNRSRVQSPQKNKSSGMPVNHISTPAVFHSMQPPQSAATHTASAGARVGLYGGLDIAGGMRFGGASGPDDLDESVVDVQIDEHELKQFDEEFSDIGEVDNTLTDEADALGSSRDSQGMHTQARHNLPPFYAVTGHADPQENEISPTISPRPSEIFGDVDPNLSNIFRSGPSDMFGMTGNTSGSQPTVYSNNLSDDEPDIDQLGQRGEATGQRSDESEVRGRLGEGQEEEVRMYNRRSHNQSVPSGGLVPERLDSMYFRQSPLTHDGGDGQEETSNPSASSVYRQNTGLFDEEGSMDGGERSPGGSSSRLTRGRLLESMESSEIDTDDEIAAVRRENNQREQRMRSQVGDQSGARGTRPGLEGVSFDDDREQGVLETRQSAEGDVVTSPVPGDGGGGGDGSSGHSSEDDSGHGGSVGPGGTGSHTTLDVLRGLGLNNSSREGSTGHFSPIRTQHNPYEEDNPEAQERIRPMGDDLLSEMGGARTVRFASPAEVRGRTLSGASTEEEDYSVANSNQDDDGDSQLASELLLPSGGGGSLEASRASGVWGLEHSTFNIGDLCQPDPDDSTQYNDEVFMGARAQPRLEEELSDQALFPEEDEVQDFTFSQKMTFGDPGQFSLMDPSASPQSDRTDRKGSIDSRASLHSTSRDMLDVPHTGKTFLAEDSPVYINELGEVVTDLAYKHPLSESTHDVYNPFDMTGEQGAVGGEHSQFAGDLADLGDFADMDFHAANDAVDMFDKDEEQFEKDNIFREDEVMEEFGTTLPDSWTLHSALSLEDEGPHTRLSIGHFMGTRSEALGSLDGNKNNVRPNFGSQITTPPDNRRPVVLLSDLGLGLEDVQEQPGRLPPADDIRGSGVGSDSDIDGRERTLTPEDLDQQLSPSDLQARHTYPDRPTNSSSAGSVRQNGSKGRERREPSSPAERSEDRARKESDQGSHKAADAQLPHHEEQSNFAATLNISAISKLINSASSDSKPEELVELIMKASHSKENKMAQPQRSVAQNVKDRPAKARSGSMERNRRPDGKSERPASTGQSGKRSSTGRQIPNAPDSSRTGNGMMQSTSRENLSTDGATRHSVRDSRDGAVKQTNKKRASREKNIDHLDDRTSEHGPRGLTEGTSQDKDSHKVKPATSRIPVPKGQVSERRDSRDRHSTESCREKSRDSSGKRASEERFVDDVSGGKSVVDKRREVWKSPRQSSVLSRSQRDPGRSSRQEGQGRLYDEDEPRTGSGESHSDKSEAEDHPIGDRPAGAISGKSDSASSSDSDNKDGAKKKPDLPPPPPSSQGHNLSWTGHIPREEYLTPNAEKSKAKSQKTRFSSTPMNPDEVKHFSIDPSQGSLSHISPRDVPTFTPESDENTWSRSDTKTPDIRPVQPSQSKDSKQQSTPVKTRESAGRVSRDGQRQVAPPVSSWQHNLLPGSSASTSAAVPTLLTSQSLTATIFASQFLNTRGVSALPTVGLNLPQSVPSGGGHTSPMDRRDTLLSQHPLHSPDRDDMMSDGGLGTAPNHLGVENHHVPHHQGVENRVPHHQGVENLFPHHQTGEAVVHTTPSSLYHGSVPTVRAGLYPSPHTMAPSSLYQSSIPTGQQHTLHNTAPSAIGLAQPPISVEAPSELRIPEVCCVGLSTQAVLPLHNPTSRWLHVDLNITRINVGGTNYNPNSIIPFVMKEKVIIEPYTTENIKVIFAPRQCGVYLADLHVMSSPVSEQPLQQARIPYVVTLQAVAENPNIQIVTKEDGSLNYGALPWGCQRGMPITLVNMGRATVPVRLVIASSKSTWPCFTFEKCLSGDVSMISRSARPSTPSFAPSVVNYSLPPARDGKVHPIVVMVFFKAPTRQMERTVTGGPPEQYSARVDVEVDTPNVQAALSSVTLQAAVGTARLHAPRDMDIVSFKCEMGSSCLQSVPLRNAGNIPLEVSLEVTHWPDFFTVIPMSLIIQPGSQADVIVKFEPKQTEAVKFESLLLMYVEPDGPGYELELLGEIGSTQMPHLTDPKAPLLLSNQHFLSWAGVAVGRAVQQSLKLKSNAVQMLKVKLQVRGNTQDFRIQTLFGGSQRLTENKEVVLKPQEEYPIHILYAPCHVAGSQARLQIKPINTNIKYTIPLVGYGGTSQLLIDDLESTMGSNTYGARLGPLLHGQTAITKVTLKNKGVRAAYVRALPFQDMECKKRLDGSRLVVQPNEFCIRPGYTQTVAVVLHPSEQEYALCEDNAAIVASVAFFYGDEASRQKFRKCVKRGEKLGVTLADNNPIRGVQFDVPYTGEDTVSDGKDIKETPHDVELFYSTMSRVMLALVGIPPPAEPVMKSVPMLSVHTKQDSHQLLRPSKPSFDAYSKGQSPPVKGTPALPKPLSATAHADSLPRKVLFPLQNQMALTAPAELPTVPSGAEEWVLRPDHLILTAPRKNADTAVKKIQLINYSERSLKYELSWPGHCVIATPEQGIIQAKSMTSLCVSPNSVLHSKGIQLPWSGQIHVTCDRHSKVVAVQIHEDLAMDESVVGVHTPEPLIAQPATPLVSVSTPTLPHIQSIATDSQKVAAHRLPYPPTTVGDRAELPMELTNDSQYPLKWVITSFAPPYVKEEGLPGVCRATYSVFWLPEKAGILQPQETTMVRVYFCPRKVGQYSQYWEVTSQTEATVKTIRHTYKMEFLGQGIAESVLRVEDQETQVARMQKVSSQRSPEQQQLVRVSEESVEFTPTTVGCTSEYRITIKNKDSKPHRVQVTSPLEPFRCKYSQISVEGRRYVRLPVIFRPTQAGLYEGEIVLKTDNDVTFNISLQGIAS